MPDMQSITSLPLAVRVQSPCNFQNVEKAELSEEQKQDVTIAWAVC